MATSDPITNQDGGAVADAEDEGEGEGFTLKYEPATPTKSIIKAFWNDQLFHTHTFNVASATARKAFAKEVAAKAVKLGFTMEQDVVEDELMIVAAATQTAPAGNNTEASYTLAEDPDDPDASGTFRVAPGGSVRLANFTARIDEDVVVQDELADSRQFVGHTWLDGCRGEFRISAEDFASNEKLKAMLFKAAGPKAKILVARFDELRTAISDVSGDVALRTVTTNHGWNQVDGSWTYVTANGRVDCDGFHKSQDDDALQIDVCNDEVASRLCLRGLKPAVLAATRAHLVADFLKLNDRRVMFSLLAVAALAVLQPFAGSTQRFVLWIRGLTGSGKSLAAKLALNFFGDFDLAPGAGQFANWIWSAGRLEKCGYFHRGALYLIDDYKPEVSKPECAIRVVQGYADGHGRGRLQSDTRSATVWPIRGQLIATGEDFFQRQASTLARTILIDTPNLPKDFARGARCLANRGRYRGVMADFLAHLLSDNRLDGFAAQVTMYRDFFYEGIAGRQNDARIAGNFGMLAAALYEFGRYLAPDWPSWQDDVDTFTAEDLIEVRDVMLGLVAGQQPSEVFLDELRRLIGTQVVRIIDWSVWMQNDERAPIGKLYKDQGYFAISMEGALAAVQQSLKDQGRPALAASNSAFLDQFCQDGRLLDGELHVMTTAHCGVKTVKRRIVPKGSQIRVALFPKNALTEAAEHGDVE